MMMTGIDSSSDISTLAVRIQQGDRIAIANALNLMDDRRASSQDRASILLDSLINSEYENDRHLIGLTGPPGVGKSTLSSALIAAWRKQGKTVGVLAVDPSSSVTGGALLGDRLRMMAGKSDTGVFIRSLAGRGEHGGLAAEIWPMSQVLMAAFDRILIETIGVGQSEIDVATIADTTCFVAQPAAGDSIQFLKAGVMEIPHILLVNKSDLGKIAEQTQVELQRALPSFEDSVSLRWRSQIQSVSALTGAAIPDLVDQIERHRHWLIDHNLLQTRRKEFQIDWVLKRLQLEFGSFGIDRLGGKSKISKALLHSQDSPFSRYRIYRHQLTAAFSADVGQNYNHSEKDLSDDQRSI